MYHLEKLKFNFLLSDFLECLFSKALCRVVFFYFYSQLSFKKKKKKEEKNKPSCTFCESSREACL